MDLSLFTRMDDHYNSMTKTFRKIADYLRSDYMQIPFLSIQEVAEKADVSATSVHRFCIHLNYSGFPALQYEIQSFLQKDLMDHESKEYRDWDLSENGILKSQIESNIQVLQEMMTPDLDKNFELAVSKIHKARRVYILGLRASYGVAYLLYTLLMESMDNVYILSLGADDIYDRIAGVTSDDLLFAIGFRPYDQYTVNIVRNFHSLNAQTIVLTDKPSSPLAQHVDLALLPGNRTPSYGFVMAVTIIKAIGMAINNLKETEMLEYYQRKQHFLNANDILTQR